MLYSVSSKKYATKIKTNLLDTIAAPMRDNLLMKKISLKNKLSFDGIIKYWDAD